MGETKNAQRILVGNPEGKRLLGRLVVKLYWDGSYVNKECECELDSCGSG
jgi:hypothetical protein